MTVLDNSVSKGRVAPAFSRILRAWLTADEFAELVEKTRDERQKGICYSHDYCDANMAMHAALVECGAIDEDGFEADDELLVDLFNDAWTLAQDNLFYHYEEK